MAGFIQTVTRAQMLAGNMAGGEGIYKLSDFDKQLWTDDGTTFFPTNGKFACWVSVSGTNLVSSTGGSTPLGAAGAKQVALFTLPSDISVQAVTIESTVAFNSGTSDTLSVGTAATSTLFSNAVNVHDAPGYETVTTAGQAYRPAATAVIAELTYVGAPPTAGKALIVVHFSKVPTTP